MTSPKKTRSRGTLLAVDGDSLAHRAYHGLPKSIRGAGGRPAGALVGFSNMLVRLWEAEQPRAVLVAWDSIGVPTYRNEALPGLGPHHHQSHAALIPGWWRK